MDAPEDVQVPARKCFVFVFRFFDHDLLFQGGVLFFSLTVLKFSFYFHVQCSSGLYFEGFKVLL